MPTPNPKITHRVLVATPKPGLSGWKKTDLDEMRVTEMPFDTGTGIDDRYLYVMNEMDQRRVLAAPAGVDVGFDIQLADEAWLAAGLPRVNPFLAWAEYVVGKNTWGESNFHAILVPTLGFPAAAADRIIGKGTAQLLAEVFEKGMPVIELHRVLVSLDEADEWGTPRALTDEELAAGVPCRFLFKLGLPIPGAQLRDVDENGRENFTRYAVLDTESWASWAAQRQNLIGATTASLEDFPCA